MNTIDDHKTCQFGIPVIQLQGLRMAMLKKKIMQKKVIIMILSSISCWDEVELDE